MDSDGVGGRLRLQTWPQLTISTNRSNLNRVSAVKQAQTSAGKQPDGDDHVGNHDAGTSDDTSCYDEVRRKLQLDYLWLL